MATVTTINKYKNANERAICELKTALAYCTVRAADIIGNLEDGTYTSEHGIRITIDIAGDGLPTVTTTRERIIVPSGGQR